ncbi:hypothetical protein Tco_0086764 [Tanacetum coccineum]
MFDLGFLTNTMNYIPVSVENQVTVNAGTQESYVVGSSGKDNDSTQEYILLPVHPHRTRSLVEVVHNAQEKPSKNAPKDKNVLDSEDVANKEEQHQMLDADQALQDELEKMIDQEVVAQAVDDATRQAFEIWFGFLKALIKVKRVWVLANHHTTNGHQFTMLNRHKNWLVQSKRLW